MENILQYDVTHIKGPVANMFVLLINALLFNIQLVGQKEQYPEDCSQDLYDEKLMVFDFVIVGSGAAGSSLANKLTEINKWSVLLLEAGDYPSSTTEIPGFYSTLPFSEEDWHFNIEKDSKTCLAKKNKMCTITRGKVVGGTSSINDMIYVRGLPENFNRWQIPEWNNTVVEKILHTLEGYEGNSSQYSSQFDYGTEGQINLKLLNFTHSIKDVLVKSYKEAGFEKVEKRKYVRLAEQLVYIKDGERFNMAEAFLTPIKDRPNFYFAVNSEVIKVNMDPIDNRAQSVNVKIRDKVVTIRAKKEVILACGAINNAKLLLLSGIGPAKYLQKRKIPVYKNLLGVGKHLQLHLAVPVFVGVTNCEVNENMTSGECYKDVYNPNKFFSDLLDYILNREGSLSLLQLNDITVYMHTEQTGGIIPNVGVFHSYFRINDTNLQNMIRNFQFVNAVERSLMQFNKEQSILMFKMSLLRPISSGEVLLNDKSIYGPPKITANFLTEAKDWKTLISAYDIITNIIESRSIKTQNATVLNLDIPNCRNIKKNTVKYTKCYIANMAYSLTDTSGTTKLGFACDPEMVVNKFLEVRGVRCLRVGDSSVLPYITIASSISTDTMLGFRLAEILKAKWLKLYESEYTIDPKDGF